MGEIKSEGTSLAGIAARGINTALCSFGMSGLVFHAPFVTAHPGFNFYAVWERSKKTAAELYPVVKSFQLLEEMLADPAIDLVIVNTPNYTHYEFACKALRAAKHVLVEKSFTVTVSEAEELITLSKQQNRHLAVFQNRRYDSDFKTVEKIYSEGLLGELTEAEFHFERYKPQLSPKQHKEMPVPGAGLLHDLGPHLIDQALHLFGMPLSVNGFIKITRPGSLVNDYIDIMLFYSKHTVRLKSSLLVKEPLPAYILHGTKGSFIKERADIQEDILKEGKKPGASDWGIEPGSAMGLLHTTINGEDKRINIPSLPGNYMQFYDGLYEAIIYGKPLPVTAQDGLNTMRIIEAVLGSGKTKATVNI